VATVIALYKLVRFALVPLKWLFDVSWQVSERGYVRLLRGIAAAPWLVLLVTTAVFVLSLRGIGKIGVELLPEIHQGEFTVHVGLPVGSPLSRPTASWASSTNASARSTTWP
jgi:HAE1 family hydrophobic/amphiphilic exporter-1